MAEFVYNNKIHVVTKTLPFKVNYSQDLRMGFEGRRKRKYEVAGKFIERMKKIQECSDLAQDDLTTLLV